MYAIEPVFLVFPLLCLIAGNSKYHSKKQTIITFFVLYILLYVFSLNGADIDSYKKEYVNEVVSFRHGEFVYWAISAFFMKIGVSYYVFRILLLTICAAVMLHTVNELSDNFSLSFYFLLSMFLIYMISGYRQLIVMSFSLFWFWQYFKGKKVLSTVGMALLMTFHFTAIVPLGFIIIYTIVGEKERTEKVLAFIQERFYLFLIISFVLRLVMFFLMETPLVQAFARLFGTKLRRDSFVYLGLLSRVCFLVLISYLYSVAKPEDKILKAFYWYYCFGMLLYIVVPQEFIMGRMMNNANIFCIVLIPNLIHNVSPESFNTITVIKEKRLAGFAYLLLEMGAVVILLAQLLRQNGYTPYSNILFHLDYLLQ